MEFFLYNIDLRHEGVTDNITLKTFQYYNNNLLILFELSATVSLNS